MESSQEASKLQLLSDMAIFKDLPAERIEALMESAPMRTAKKGTVFYGSDNGPEVLFLLKSGKAELYCQSPDGRKLTLAIVEQGGLFGDMSLVGQRLFGACAIAVEDSVICVLGRHDVQSLILEYPTVALRVIEVLARRLQEASDAL